MIIIQGRQSEVWKEKVDDEEGKKETGEASSKKKGCHTLTEEDTDRQGEQEEKHWRVRGEEEAEEKVGGKCIKGEGKDPCHLWKNCTSS